MRARSRPARPAPPRRRGPPSPHRRRPPPANGAAATGRTLPVDVGQARWVPALGGPFRLSLPEAAVPEAAVATEAGTAATAVLLAGPITQIVRAVEAMAVSPRVLWGNVASA